MKKRLLMVLLISLCAGFVFSDARLTEELTGVWKTDTFLTELPGGQLVASEAPYAFPRRGISEIRILDSEFIIFRLGAAEYRAFYEISELDYDNLHLMCIFKNGEKLVLKLVRADGGWKYLFRLPSGSVMAEGLVVEIDEADVAEPEAEAEAAAMEPEAEMTEGSEGSEDAEPDQILYTGIMRKI